MRFRSLAGCLGSLAAAAAAALFVLPLSAHAAVTISSDTTQNMSCTGGVCAPTATKAVLNAGDLEAMLASGDVTVTTTGSGVQARDIDVKAPFSWATSSILALTAQRNIAIDKSVSVSGTGGVALVTNQNGKVGAFAFGKKGNIDFANLSSALTINGTPFTLIGDIHTLANDIAANPSGAYALAADYDASQDGTYSSSPVATMFSGSFEGLGNSISNLTIVSADQIFGLFYWVSASASVADLALHNVTASDTNPSAGEFGGLAGFLGGRVTRTSVSGTLTGSSFNFVGGLIGDADIGSEITNCASSAKIEIPEQSSEGAYIGGLIGGNLGLVSLSRSTGRVSNNGGQGSFAGGLVGENLGTIDQSWASGRVSVLTSGSNGPAGGGLVGYNFNTSASITNSYATGKVTGQGGSKVGGLVGYIYTGTISTSLAIGKVGTGGISGGFIGSNKTGDLSDDYWDTTTSRTDQGVGHGSSEGVTGLTTTQLQSGLPSGFDPAIWVENPNINNGLPYLVDNPPHS